MLQALKNGTSDSCNVEAKGGNIRRKILACQCDCVRVAIFLSTVTNNTLKSRQ